MSIRVLKIVGAIIVLLIVLGLGLISGYIQGMYDGKTAVFNQRKRDWTQIIESTVNAGGYQNLALERTGDGYVIIHGNLSRERLAELRETLIQKFGSQAAELALMRVSESNDSDAVAHPVVPTEN